MSLEPNEPHGDPPAGRPDRPSIADRAARRAATHGTADAERYDRLLRQLRAGHELELERPTRFRLSWDIVHANFWRVTGAIALGLAIYVIALNAFEWWRSVRVDTWAGPGAAVTSGQQLPTCAAGAGAPAHPSFPNWVRFEDRLFVLTEAVWPMIEAGAVAADYPPSGHTLGSVALHRAGSTPEGRAGELILLRESAAPSGRLYRHVAACD
jgi:hypothetical protein